VFSALTTPVAAEATVAQERCFLGAPCPDVKSQDKVVERVSREFLLLRHGHSPEEEERSRWKPLLDNLYELSSV
jgi:hypothetical protein